MRAPNMLAAIALAGTVLLGGAGQALADDTDDNAAISGVGTNFEVAAPATPGQNTSGVDQDESNFGQVGSILDRIIGR